MTTGVVGGTGMIGSKAVKMLADRGEEVRILTRTPPAEPTGGVGHHAIDLTTGEGLMSGFAGLDLVIDLGNTRENPEDTLVDGTRRILDACRRTGVGHYAGISIVGCEKVNIGYYRAKAAQEEVIRSSPVSWSLLRATQFHELLDQVFSGAARRGITPLAGIPLQTVAADEAAKAIVAAAEARVPREITTLVGPEILTVSEMGRAWRKARKRRTLLLPVPVIGRAMKGLKAGGLTEAGAPAGGPGFKEWLLSE